MILLLIKTKIEPSKKIVEKAIGNQDRYDIQIRYFLAKEMYSGLEIIGIPEVINDKLIRYYGTNTKYRRTKR